MSLTPSYVDASSVDDESGTNVPNNRKEKGNEVAHTVSFGVPVWSGNSDGKYGSALRFDGVNDYVNCGNDPSLDMKSN